MWPITMVFPNPKRLIITRNYDSPKSKKITMKFCFPIIVFKNTMLLGHSAIYHGHPSQGYSEVFGPYVLNIIYTPDGV